MGKVSRRKRSGWAGAIAAGRERREAEAKEAADREAWPYGVQVVVMMQDRRTGETWVHGGNQLGFRKQADAEWWADEVEDWVIERGVEASKMAVPPASDTRQPG